MMDSSREDPWICKAAEIEKFHDQSHKRGTFLIVYQLGLSSVQLLSEDHVKGVLEHMYRNCPCLGICFGERDGTTWLRRATNPNIDFQVVSGIEPDEVRYQLHEYQYNSETGPLWCARLLADKNNPYVMDKGFPHSYQLFLGTTHSLTDGITLANIFGSIVGLLNDVIDGKPLKDNEQIGYFISDTESEKIIASKMVEMERDPSLMTKLSRFEGDKGIGMPLLLSVIPSPEGEDKAHNLTHVLDTDTTRRFISKCKTEGVTVHSAFTALVDATLVTLLEENNHKRDSYRLCNGHIINLRRYWQGDHRLAQGCHAHFPLRLWAHVPSNIMENFWEFVRNLQKDLHHHIKEETILKLDALMKINIKEGPTVDDFLCSSSPCQVDCGLSNLGDVTASLTEGGNHVKPYVLIRHTSMHKTNIQNFAHFFHTFRGRLILNLIYNTKFFTKAFVRKYCNEIFRTLKKVIEVDAQ